MRIFIVTLLTISILGGSLFAEDKMDDLVKRYKEQMKNITTAIALTKLDIGRNQQAKDLADRYLKLANLYVEKAKFMFYIEQEEKELDENNEIDLALVNENRRQAVALYELILKNFTKFDKRDRVMILIANEYQQLNDKKNMIKIFERLLKEFPKSKYRSEGNMVLGNHYYDNHDIAKAKIYYRKIINDVPGPVTDIAKYKLAWCYINDEKYEKSLALFEQVLKSKRDTASASQFLQKAINVKDESLIDSVLPYTSIKKRKATDAPRYYFELASSRAMYLKVLDKLANRYFTGSEFTKSVIVYRELLKISNNVEKNLLYTSRIWKLLKYLKGGEQFAGDEAERLEKHLVRYKNSWRMPREDLKKFIVDYEMYMRHVATKADKLFRKRGKKDKRLASQVSESYKFYLNSFPKNRRYKLMRRNYSGILYDRKDMLNAGKTFEEMSKNETSKEKRLAALRTSLFCYNEVLKDEDNSLYDKAWARAGIKDLSLKYLKIFPRSKKSAAIKYNVSRLTFEQGQQEEGIKMLKDYMRKYPRSIHIADAGNKILDYYNMQSDYDALVREGKSILAIKGIKDNNFKKQVRMIISSAAKAKIYDQTEELAIAETEKEFFDVAKKFKGTAAGAESLFNAFQVARNKNNHYLALESAEMLSQNYPKYRNIKIVMKTLPDIYLRNLQFDRAVKSAEKFYKRYPKAKGASQLMETSGDIYSHLAEYGRSNSIYKSLIKRGAKNSTILLGKIGDNYFKDASYSEAEAAYEKYNRRINKMESNAKLARAYMRQGKTSKMERHYGITLKKCGPRCRRTPGLRSIAAEAQFYLIDKKFKSFMKRKISNKNLDKSVADMSNLFAGLERAYANVINFGDPNWAVAALYNLGHIYSKMGEFLEGARPPKQYNKAQKREFKKLMRGKVQSFEKESKSYFTSCKNKAHTLNVYSEYALKCGKGDRENYRVEPREPSERRVRGFRGKSIHAKLLKKPYDVNLMQDLAEIYYNAGDYHTAKVIALKVLEKKSDNDVLAILGDCYAKLDEDSLAYSTFMRVYRASSSHSGARNGLRKLYKKYGNSKYKGM